MEQEDYRPEIVRNFIHAYNNFDLQGMVKHLHQDVKFENIVDGKVDVETRGIESFTDQAAYAIDYFMEREMGIVEIQVAEDSVVVDIEYTGILSKDIPGGPRAGDTLRLKGKSVYKFSEGKIIHIQDIN